jgi:hypothetical protein
VHRLGGVAQAHETLNASHDHGLGPNHVFKVNLLSLNY